MVNLAEEYATLRTMVGIYCRRQHGGKELCSDCAELLEYAGERLGRCPFGIEKPTCQTCLVHCYQPAIRERVQAVMSFAGPRMIWNHPWMALRHLIHNHRSPR